MDNAVYFMLTHNPDHSAAARDLLARALGFLPEIARGVHGKPYFPAYPHIHFSISHTRGAAVCALSDRPCGVDVEHPRPIRTQLAARCFSKAERAYADTPERFLEIWTRKEAFLKRDGRGITVPLASIDTLSCDELVSFATDGFVISFCGTPAICDFVDMS